MYVGIQEEKMLSRREPQRESHDHQREYHKFLMQQLAVISGRMRPETITRYTKNMQQQAEQLQREGVDVMSSIEHLNAHMLKQVKL